MARPRRQASACLRGFILMLLLASLQPAFAFAESGEGEGAQITNLENSLESASKESEELRLKSEAEQSSIGRLRQEGIAAAAAIQALESDITWLEKKILALDNEEKDKSEGLAANRGQLTGVLAALQRMALRPPEALLAQPLNLSSSVRGAILLRAAAPLIEQRAKKLRYELAALEQTRNEAFKRRAELAASVSKITMERARMDDLLVHMARLNQQTESDRQKITNQAQALASQAENMRDLLSRLDDSSTRSAASFPPPASGSSIASAKGSMPYPVVGELAGQYGHATQSGLTSKGITIETRGGAQVVAPFKGRIVFAGRFRGYGQLLIIEHGEGYHTLLAGLERIDGAIGQHVLSGEPVGTMGSGDGAAPTLYVELRRHGRPINPLPWLSARKDKVSG